MMAMETLTSQPLDRFQRHVGFDNVPSGETSKKVPSSLVLSVRHDGYQPRRRSRTFMVGIDEHPYSDYAIQWLLDELVDDGDEIICVRVIEKEMRVGEKSYHSDAQKVMKSILEKNGSNRAVAFTLEYAVGKLHATFQSLVCGCSLSCICPKSYSLPDPTVSTGHAHCGHAWTFPRRSPRPCQQSQLVFKILPAVLSHTRRGRAAY